MVAELKRFWEDLAEDALRVVRPTKFLFLCGGAIATTKSSAAVNLRDYLWRVKPMRLAYPTVLAEQALQLYRDSKYDDLISFEEDIARIASIVVVIAESAGSLAELGAFASNDVIRRVLRVLIQDTYAKAESFIRWGPVQRLSRDRRDYLGVYPWKTLPTGGLNVNSTKPHYMLMKNFISGHLDKIPETSQYILLQEERIFYLIYWIIFVCKAISPENLRAYLGLIGGVITSEDLTRKLYCMKLAKWIDMEPYDGKDFLYTLTDVDSIDYRFKSNVKEKKVIRRKLEVYSAHDKLEQIPLHIRILVASARKGSAI